MNSATCPIWLREIELWVSDEPGTVQLSTVVPDLCFKKCGKQEIDTAS